jgi:hypothetical protein
VSHRAPKPAERDCPDCRKTNGMALQNVVALDPVNIPLLYICGGCGCLLTVPPIDSPLRPIQSRESSGTPAANAADRPKRRKKNR